MPLSPIIIIFGPDGKPIPGPVAIPDRETPGLTGCYGEEFSHNIYTILKNYLYALVYGVDFIRKHEPMCIVKQLDKMSVLLMNYLKNGTFLKKAEVRWYEYHEKQGKTEEYFRMTLEHVRLHAISYNMPNVKDEAFERYGHLEELQLMYQKITWHYLKGNLIYTDIWEDAYGELDTKDFSVKKNVNDDTDFITIPEALKLTFTSGTFIPPKEGFLFDKEASVKFTLTANRPMEMKDRKLYAKLYAIYKGKTEDMGITQEGRPREKEYFWTTEFTLRKPQAYLNDKDRAADATVGYYAVIDCVYATNNNYRSDTVTLPMGKELKIAFADEEECVFSDASFNLKTSDNVVGIANGSIALLEDPGRLDIIFPMAMNYQPGSMPTNV